MSAQSFDDLECHVGHQIECVFYGDANVAVECVSCSVVLIDFDRPSSYVRTPAPCGRVSSCPPEGCESGECWVDAYLEEWMP